MTASAQTTVDNQTSTSPSYAEASQANNYTTAKATTPSSKKKPGAFLTISEVADELGVQQHVLRFWETKFTQVKPLKRGGGRRYYRPEDIALLKKIHHLLYTDKYTIKGAQKLLRGQSKMQIVKEETANQSETPQAKAASNSNDVAASSNQGLNDVQQREVLEEMLTDLRSLRSMIKRAE